jgi:hypothetical protein
MDPADVADEALSWKPPYCASDTELTCPVCGVENAVRVREQESYLDANDYEGYCCDCHAELTVWAAVDIAFVDVEAVPSPSLPTEDK